MAFTNGNDFNILQGSDAAVVSAFGGNDVYVLDTSLLANNQRISISDTLGTNRLQLVGGLTIASSAIAADTLQLTLSNGAVITILGASTFNYTTGGSIPLGTGGLTQNFSQFVTGSLGAAAVPIGNAVVMGTPNTMVNESGGTTGTGGAGIPSGPGGGFTTNPQTITVTGGPGNDSLLFNELNRYVIQGLAGNDTLGGGSMSDTLDGGAGVDTVVFKGLFSEYVVSLGSDAQSLIFDDPNFLRDGRDVVSNVEFFAFRDTTLSFDNVKARSGLTTGTGLNDQARALSVVDPDLGTLASRATPNVTELVSDFVWQRTALTFSFNTELPAEYRTTASTPADRLTNGWRPLNDIEKGAARQAIQSINTVLGLQITEVGNNGDLRFNAVTPPDNRAFAFLPGEVPVGGDVFLNNNLSANDYELGRSGRLTLIHELGHALGLKHSFEGPNVLAVAFDNLSNTVMTYNVGLRDLIYNFSFSGSRISTGTAVQANPDKLALLDIAALQALYGPNVRTALSDTTYNLPQSQGGYLTVWDAGGTDTIDVSSVNFRSVVDLRSGKTSSIGLKTTEELIGEAVLSLVAQGASFNQADAFVRGFYTRADVTPRLYNGQDNLSIVQGVVIENVLTGAGNDEVTDNSVNNRIATGSGNDTVRLGAGGFDFVDAGGGMDTVVLTVRQSDVQREMQANGHWLLVGTTFAVELVGVETLMFSDSTVTA